MNTNNKKIKFMKQHRGRMKGVACRGNNISFGKYALKAQECSWITTKQIEAGRRSITRFLKREGKIWIRIFPDKPITLRSTGTRMGSGKGNPHSWIFVLKPEQIIYELSNISEISAQKAFKIAASKISIKTKFIKK
uniref:ribosomal protein L16 n=1 Tax=Hydnora longicollis TaxID=1778543 RepID=UPI0021142741|nr:ribosomal protein L16 [Hydnora longicollis]USN93657.1 ribosomal protein L16 [Hydnora longicollis]